MPETAIILLSLGAGAVIGVLGMRFISAWVEKRAYSIAQGERGLKGRAVRQENEERLYMAMAEALNAIKAGAKPEDVLKEVGAKYPDVVTRIMAKGLQGKLPAGLRDLMEE